MTKSDYIFLVYLLVIFNKKGGFTPQLQLYQYYRLQKALNMLPANFQDL